MSKSQRREQKGSPARTADEISDDNVAFEIVLKHEIFADVKESSTIRLKAFQEELTGRCKLCSLLVDESVHSNALRIYHDSFPVLTHEKERIDDLGGQQIEERLVRGLRPQSLLVEQPKDEGLICIRERDVFCIWEVFDDCRKRDSVSVRENQKGFPHLPSVLMSSVERRRQ